MLDSDNQKRTHLESELKRNAQEIAALKATEKQLAKVFLPSFLPPFPLSFLHVDLAQRRTI